MMADPAHAEMTDWDRAYREAMAAEVLWAPIHFDGWGLYEQARPAMPGETIEMIGRWPEHGYTLQYRSLLGELTQACQTPIDQFPEVTVLGRLDETDLPQLCYLADHGQVDELSRVATRLARTDRTIPTEPPVRTGSTIPEHSEVDVRYFPSEGRCLDAGHLIHEDHPSAVYAVAGHWGTRLGPPVGLTPTGLLVFQPRGLDGARITIEHPVSQPVSPRIIETRVGIYRHDGLGGWHQTATLAQPDELQRLVASPDSAPALTRVQPAAAMRGRA